MNDALLRLLRNEPLVSAIVGGIVGSVAALAGTIVLEWWREMRRRRQLRHALVAALMANVRVMDRREHGEVGSCLDLLILDATASSKYEVLPVSECEAVDAARAKLHLLEPARRLASERLQWQFPTILEQARSACDAALVLLRGHGEPRPTTPAKPKATPVAAEPAEP